MRRGLGLGVVGILAATLLSACGEEGKPTLNWYINPDGVDTFIARAAECSTDDYDIEIQMLPTSATDQRVQLARRLAAEDSSTDLMNLDPVFVRRVRQRGLAGRGHRRQHRGQPRLHDRRERRGRGRVPRPARPTP